MTFTKSLASISTLRLPKKHRSKANRNLHLGAWACITILGGAAGFWAFKTIARARNRKRTEKGRFPFGSKENQMGAAELERQWHSLDQIQAKGHVPRDLAREPKDMDQKIHAEPIKGETSYFD